MPQHSNCKKQNPGGEVRLEVSRKEKQVTYRRTRKENGIEFSTAAVEARETWDRASEILRERVANSEF